MTSSYAPTDRLFLWLLVDPTRPILVGTWAAAEWAIAFYRRYGFVQVTPEERTRLLRRYWDIPDRQIETSVVLANPPLSG